MTCMQWYMYMNVFRSGSQSFHAIQSIPDWHHWAQGTLLDALYGTEISQGLLMKVGDMICSFCTCPFHMEFPCSCYCPCIPCGNGDIFPSMNLGWCNSSMLNTSILMCGRKHDPC